MRGRCSMFMQYAHCEKNRKKNHDSDLLVFSMIFSLFKKHGILNLKVSIFRICIYPKIFSYLTS